jgi:hypothetical protein
MYIKQTINVNEFIDINNEVSPFLIKRNVSLHDPILKFINIYVDGLQLILY